ncbi:hypothetical protein EBR56_07400 [bacterium]|nr:hypothetical protein [bacterium]
MRCFLTEIMIVTACIAAGAVMAADDAATVLAERLAPHVGQTLDLVELGTGKRLVRPTLVGLTERKDAVTALRLRAEGETKTVSVSLAGIVKIIAARETVYELSGAGGSAAQLRGRRAREAYERQLQASAERMRERGVEPWPPLSAAGHAEQVAALEAFVADAKAAFPALETAETHEFLVATDIPGGQIAPYLANLDAMHDFLCDLYAIPRGEPVWLGKCLVVAFASEDDFRAFEGRFFDGAPRGVHGLCHQRSDGRVVMACHRGDDASAFGHMLVHETSHGFNHRWKSPERLPNWLNEGIAEWVGTQVVPACRQVPLKEARALELMRARRSLGDGFFDPDPDFHIQPDQYGIASSLVRFMVARDRKKFAAFVQGIKEGLDVETSLQQSYRGSLADLVQAYGKAIGVPDLAP